MKPSFRLASVAALGLALSLTLNAQTIWHPVNLNWDFSNFTGQQVNDFTIIVASDTYNPNNYVVGMPFPTFNVSHGNFVGSDPGNETKLQWSGATVNPNELAHIGLDLTGAGRVLDAYWTWNGVKVDGSLAISDERAEVRLGNSGAIHMDLNIAQGFFESHPGEQAGWANVRTFVNIPAGLLSLQDINQSLNLSTLSAYEVIPQQGVPGFPGSSGLGLPGQILLPDADSFFDVYVDVVPDGFISPNYETLLVAEVLNQGQVVGMFWNLATQCPEPSSLSLLLLAGLLLAFRPSRH